MMVKGTGLTLVGYGWSLLSLAGAAIVCAGFYIPVWLVGTLTLRSSTMPTYFGCFRRCNFPVSDPVTERIELNAMCGRYHTIGDIPSLWWRIATVLVGVGSALGLLIAFVTVAACCIRDVVSRTSARLLGLFQILSAIMILAGSIMYPLGWDNKEVREACGSKAGPYNLGYCTIGWAFYMVLGGACLLLICGSLSTTAGHPIDWEKLTNTSGGYDERSDLKTVNI